ncbi:MAG: Ig-like domain-containing protein, partial [Chloroflexota bacterium]
TWTYDPAADHHGSDSFTFTANDGFVDSNTATMSVTVNPVNDVPTFTPGGATVTVAEDSGAYSAAWATGISAGPNESSQAVDFLVSPTNAGLFSTAPAISAAGTLTFTPAANAHGTSTVTVRIHDDGGTAAPGSVDTSAPVTFDIVISSLNDAPVAATGSGTIAQDIAGDIGVSATDVDGDATTLFAIATGPSHGSVEFTAPYSCNGLVPNVCTTNAVYTPDPGYHGPDSFTYTATDGTGTSAPATVTVTVSPNDPPVCAADSTSGLEDAQQSGTITCTDTELDPLVYALVGAAAHGTAVVNANGTWTYDPAADHHGSDSFTFRANDGHGNSNTATMTVTVNPVDDVPSFTPGAATVTVAEDSGAYSAPWAAGISAGPNESYQVVDFLVSPTNASLFSTAPAISAVGTLTFTPAANAHGTSTVTVRIHDDGGSEGAGSVDTSASVTFDIVVTSVNDAPVCSPASTSGNEDTQQTGTITCSDVDLDPLTYSRVANASHGSATVNANGTWSYQPTLNSTSADSFTFKANDGHVDSGTATMSITIVPQNDAPTCFGDGSSGAEDTLQSGTITTCTDVETPGSLTYALASAAVHGTAVVNANGSWTYMPSSNWNGPDSFTFKANDGLVDSNAATMSIDVTAVNDAPVANDQSVSTAEDTAKAITLTGSDVEGSGLTYTVTTDPAHGTLTGTAPSLTYHPDGNYNGPDSFTFKVDDGSLDSLVDGIVTIDVTAVNDAPVANDQSVSTAEDTAKAITLTGSDVEGSGLTYTVTTDPAHGTLTGTAPSLTYHPDGNYNGPDSFTFKVDDGSLDSLVDGIVTIEVTAVNDTPVCAGSSTSGNEDVQQVGTITCTDADNDPLTYSLVSSATHGAAAVATDGSWTYDPAGNYHGADSFTFKANDGQVDSSAATMSITVHSVNDQPVCTGATLATDKNVAVVGGVTCTDADNDPLELRIGTGPGKGTVDPFDPATGDFTYTPAKDVSGADSFTVIAFDGTVDSDPAIVEIGIDNHAPVCSDAAPAAADEDTVQSGTLSCTDADLDALVHSVVTQAGHGVVVVTPGTGDWTYTPAGNYNGPDSFTFEATDGVATSNLSTITLSVTAVNDIPVATPQSVTLDEDTAGTQITLTGTDVELSALTYSVATPVHGALTGTAPDLTYKPVANYNGPDSFTFTVYDGTSDSLPATVSITVTDLNDKPIAKTDAGIVVRATTTTTINVLANDFTGPLVGGAPSEPSDTITVTGVGTASRGIVSIAPGGAGVIYDPKGCSIGDDLFTYTISDSHGEPASGTVILTIARPGQDGLAANPILDTPTAGFLGNGAMTTGVPIRVAWCGVTKAGTTMRGFNLYQSTNGGTSFGAAILAGTKATSSVRTVAVGPNFAWRVVAADAAGRRSVYKATPATRISRWDDRSTSITRTGWVSAASPTAFGKTLVSATSAGASATISITGRQFAIVAPRGPGLGSLRVYVDGVLVGTVSERQTTAAGQRLVFVGSLAAGTHTIKVSPAGNGRIYLDAILALQ